MYDFTFFTMPQGIIRCKDTKKRRNKRSLLFFLDNIIFFRQACTGEGVASFSPLYKQEKLTFFKKSRMITGGQDATPSPVH